VILVLQKNTTLEKLYLCGNEIGDKGGKAIGKALEVSFVLVSSFVFLCGYLPSSRQPSSCDFGAAEEHDAQGAKLGAQQDW
jgi:hypothetical protein